MIIQESLQINGKDFVKTYSDEGFTIMRDGVEYAEAIDPEEFGRRYTETDHKIERHEDE